MAVWLKPTRHCSPFLLSAQPSPLCVEAATSVFNGMSRNGRIVPACLKYRVSLNNPPPPPPSFRKLRRSCCSEDVLSSLFSNSNKLSPCLLFSAALFARHWGDDEEVAPWKDLSLLDSNSLDLVSAVNTEHMAPAVFTFSTTAFWKYSLVSLAVSHLAQRLFRWSLIWPDMLPACPQWTLGMMLLCDKYMKRGKGHTLSKTGITCVCLS